MSAFKGNMCKICLNNRVWILALIIVTKMRKMCDWLTWSIFSQYSLSIRCTPLLYYIELFHYLIFSYFSFLVADLLYF